MLIERNKKFKTNTLHISLNFSPEDDLTDEKMQRIALDYMARLGFSEQPFLVYKHNDTKHPHLHIVTTNIKEDRSFIDLIYIAKKKSEPARKAIEIYFGLIRAEGRGKGPARVISALDLLPADYGREETKHVITNLVNEVVRGYKFTSLQEFNLILRKMNIVADRGHPQSRMFQTGGLVYSLLNKNGYRIGQSIKASDLYLKPTLKALQKKFSPNTVKKQIVKQYTARSVMMAMKYSLNARDLDENLKRRNISLHIDQDRLGIIKAVHFVDHRNRAVFDNQELGVTLNDMYRLRAAEYLKLQPAKKYLSKGKTQLGSNISPIPGQPFSSLIQSLLQPGQGMRGPDEDPRKRKKRKKRGPSP